MKKPVFYTELTYLLGILILALGATVLVTANFGVSVVVAPAYLLHLKLSQTWSFVTFGVAEYIVQGLLLVLLILVVRRFHWSYLFSFVTALFYGRVLDLMMLLIKPLSLDHLGFRMLLFVLGLLLCALGVALVLRTYISPGVYELLIRELSFKYSWELGPVKTTYDCSSCLLSILLSFSFFGLFQFVGVNIGTVLCALLNGPLVTLIGRFLDSHFTLMAASPSAARYFNPPPFPEKKPGANTQTPS